MSASITWLTQKVAEWRNNSDAARINVRLGVLRDVAADLDRLATLEAALRTIRSAVPGYLKKEMTAEEFAILVIGEADSGMVNKALEGCR